MRTAGTPTARCPAGPTLPVILRTALRAAASTALLAITAASCTGVRTLSDPVVVIETEGGVELGASTDYGVVFLGRSAQAGRVRITAWFGDGPQTELSVIEPVGGEVYTAETEIRLPQVRMSFRAPRRGDEVLVVGRRNGRRWSRTVQVREDPRVDGILLPHLRQVGDGLDQSGAGVFVVPDGEEHRMELVGLVSGTLSLTDESGTRQYTTVVGMEDLWRLVAHRRELVKRRPSILREDVQ